MPPLTVLFSDNHLLVVDKPAGLPTMGSESGTQTVARQAAEYIQHKYHKPGKAFIGIVSRLDRLVSGVLVLARTSKAASRLSDQIRQNRVGKFYMAIVEGQWPIAEGHVAARNLAAENIAAGNLAAGNLADGNIADGGLAAEAPLWHELVDWVAKDEANHRMRVVSESKSQAQLARLRVRPLAYHRGQTLLRIQLLTGRKHQIRLQLAEYGTPICGDAKYGGQSHFSPGIALHCQQVTCAHPTLKESMTFIASPSNHWHNLSPAFLPWLSPHEHS